VIIDSCLKGEIVPEKIRLFSKYTLNPENFREYKWTGAEGIASFGFIYFVFSQ